jgi:hypothetical protein
MPPSRQISCPIFHRLLLVVLLLGLGACSSLNLRDPLQIDLAGLEPLPGESMEMRFALQLRVQNPNSQPVDFRGVALELEVNGQPLASGVSDQSGQIPGFGEKILSIPVSITAFSMMRQAWAAAGYKQGSNLPYELNGKLAGGLFGTHRFSASGTLNWPQPMPTP